MTLRITILLLFVLSVFTKINAQDRHFTLFNFAPLVINPAYTGAYEGSYRVGGIIREQAFSNNIPDLGSVYSTQSGFVDAPLLNVRKRDWVGVGVNYYTDRAGTFGLGYTTFHGSIAYHLALDKRQKNVLTLGISAGRVNRSINGARGRSNAAFAEGTVVLPEENTTIPLQGGESTGFFDLGTGMLLKSQINKATKIELGFSLQHITGNFQFPNNGVTPPSNYILVDSVGTTNSGRYTIPKLFVLHGNYDMQLTEIWSLTPSFLFQQYRTQNEAVIQFLGGYKLLRREVRDDGKKGKLIKDDEAPKIRFGLGYRIGDAMQILLGYEKGPLRVGIGYDLTLSTLADANNRNGAVEIAANYIFKVYKQPNVDPAILCPKF